MPHSFRQSTSMVPRLRSENQICIHLKNCICHIIIDSHCKLSGSREALSQSIYACKKLNLAPVPIKHEIILKNPLLDPSAFNLYPLPFNFQPSAFTLQPLAFTPQPFNPRLAKQTNPYAASLVPLCPSLNSPAYLDRSVAKLGCSRQP